MGKIVIRAVVGVLFLNSLTAAMAGESAPNWFPKAPPLAQSQGPVVRVSNVDELLRAISDVADGSTILLADGNYKFPDLPSSQGRNRSQFAVPAEIPPK
jgi:hypothetical protein